MRNLVRHANDAIQMLEEININCGTNIRFKVNNRFTSTWGRCKKIYSIQDPLNFTFEIQINSDLLDERNSLSGLYSTIIHELIHTLPGCMNHGPTFKYYADLVNNNYDWVTIKRVSTAEEKGVTHRKPETVMARKIKHKFQCQKCGNYVTRVKESNFTRHPEWYRCGNCGGKFLKIF